MSCLCLPVTISCTYASWPEDSAALLWYELRIHINRLALPDVDESAVRSYEVIQGCGHRENIWVSKQNRNNNHEDTVHIVWAALTHIMRLIRHEDFEGFSLHADMAIYSCTDLLEHSASPQILSSASLSMRMTPAVWCSSPAQRRSSSGEIMLTTRGEGEVVRVDVCGTLMLFKKKKKMRRKSPNASQPGQDGLSPASWAARPISADL